MQRVGIIGVGNIGSTLTHMLLQQRIGVHIGVYDLNTDVLQGKIWDLEEASVIGDCEGSIEIVSSIQAFNTYDVVVITAGRARTPGMDRKDLLQENAFILQDIAKQLQNFSDAVFGFIRKINNFYVHNIVVNCVLNRIDFYNFSG